MKSVIEKQEDANIKLTITIPVAEIKKTRELLIENYSKNAELPGFRKGKAPANLVEEKIDEEKIREEILRRLLPLHYSEAIKEHNLKPIVNPQIHIQKIEEGKDWVFEAITCEMPDIDLDNYKENIKKITAKSKIALPGKEPQPANFDEIMKALLDSVKIKIPKIITDQETDRLLAQTLDEIKKLGLTLDQYLASTQRTPQALRQEFEQRAQNDIKIEFALQKIAEEEKLTVTEAEINEAILKAKDEEERKNLEANKYLLANILRQQKTLDYIRSL